MKIEKFHIYLADLGVSFGTEPGKTRPVVVIQTDILNNIHNSTIICPMTSKVISGGYPLRLNIKSKGPTGLGVDSDILVEQIKSIDNTRFKKHLGSLPADKQALLMESLQMILFE
ncbi:MAG: type II toxin-antitoxin system PemK/MazF family toxin [Candidatus Omnitrophica bacterium]|nr:type II toxin-antitoxin system PemK/MazF family toxin [Candidatus Omnitrophota bacterium]